MTKAEAKAKWDAAVDAAKDKHRAYFYAKIKADKLEKAYLTALEQQPEPDAQTSQQMCGDWYKAERLAEKARVEARLADDAQDKAAAVYAQIVAQEGA